MKLKNNILERLTGEQDGPGKHRSEARGGFEPELPERQLTPLGGWPDTAGEATAGSARTGPVRARQDAPKPKEFQGEHSARDVENFMRHLECYLKMLAWKADTPGVVQRQCTADLAVLWGHEEAEEYLAEVIVVICAASLPLSGLPVGEACDYDGVDNGQLEHVSHPR
ncbi:hypothetical protein HAX54_018986 [Datura stramonium]|uniref:Uncharacterized protein n=1 Tax=Datura stramonium TaxID=4076 RepID=A0ABS8UPW3_DATST|nr:hypothetical protein [Datura stramonium]